MGVPAGVARRRRRLESQQIRPFPLPPFGRSPLFDTSQGVFAMNVNCRRAATLVVVALAASGCGGDSRSLATATVTGTVKYKTALPEGQIVFQHATGEPSAAKFGPDGKYTAEVAIGKNQVLVTSQESSLANQDKGPAKAGPKMMEIYTSRIPERYGNFNTSGLEVEVKDGSNTFDVNLEDK